MRFREGDRVRVRQWDDMAEEYGVEIVAGLGSITPSSSYDSPHFITPMKDLCGLSGTVEHVGCDEYEDGVDAIRVKFDLDDGESDIDFAWSFCSTMFEPEIEVGDAIFEFVDNI